MCQYRTSKKKQLHRLICMRLVGCIRHLTVSLPEHYCTKCIFWVLLEFFRFFSLFFFHFDSFSRIFLHSLFVPRFFKFWRYISSNF
jgi:hypothetical protein